MTPITRAGLSVDAVPTDDSESDGTSSSSAWRHDLIERLQGWLWQ